MAGFNRNRDVTQHELICKVSSELNSQLCCKRLKYVTKAAFNKRLPADVEEELQEAHELLEEKDFRIDHLEHENATLKTSVLRLLSKSQLNFLQAADGYEEARGDRDGQQDHLRVDDNTADANILTHLHLLLQLLSLPLILLSPLL